MIFNNEEFGQVRVVEINNKPWFVGKDIAEALKYARPTKAIQDNVDNEDKILLNEETQSSVRTEINYKELGQRGGWLINESGLYSLIFNSKLESAQRFKHWVTSEVLPTIHNTGGYVHNDNLFIETYLPFADDNTKALFSSVLSTMRQQNEIIKQQRATIELKEQENITLKNDNASLAGDILTWSDRNKLNFGIRKLSNATKIFYSKLWNKLYKQLKYKYSIDVKARAKKDFIKTIKEDEWPKVSLSFSAICEKYEVSPTEMLKQD